MGASSIDVACSAARRFVVIGVMSNWHANANHRQIANIASSPLPLPRHLPVF